MEGLIKYEEMNTSEGIGTVIRIEDPLIKREPDLEGEFDLIPNAIKHETTECTEISASPGQFEAVYIKLPQIITENYETPRARNNSKASNVSSKLPEEEKKFYSFCRLCAKQSDSMVHILSQNESSISILRKINYCLPVRVRREDDLPKYVCHSCLAKLEWCYEFNKSVTDATKKLRVYRKRTSDSIRENEEGGQSSAISNQKRIATSKCSDKDNKLNRIINTDDSHRIPEAHGNAEKSKRNLKKINSTDTANLDNDNIASDSRIYPKKNLLNFIKTQGFSNSDKDRSRKNLSDLENAKIYAMTNDYPCPYCDRIFQTEIQWMTHRLEHREIRITEKTNEQNESIQDSADWDNYPCSSCSKSFKTQTECDEHRLEHKKLRKSKRKVQSIDISTNLDHYPCSVCSKSFETEIDCENHRLEHKEIKKLKRIAVPKNCIKSDSNFAARLKQNFQKLCHKAEEPQEPEIKEEPHFMQQKNDPAIECTLCKKRFHSNAIEKHTKICIRQQGSSKTIFACAYCKKEFDRKIHLSAHISMHTGERPYSCKLCSKRFRTKRTRNDHLRLHSGDRHFKCPMCKMRFSKISDLRGHSYIHSYKKIYKCPLCNEIFDTKSGRNNHMDVHVGEKFYQCDLCKNYFNSKANLITHLETQHKTFLQ